MARVTVPQIPGARVRSRRGGAAGRSTVPRVHVLQQLAVTSVGVASIRELDVDGRPLATAAARLDGPAGAARYPGLQHRGQGRRGPALDRHALAGRRRAAARGRRALPAPVRDGRRRSDAHLRARPAARRSPARRASCATCSSRASSAMPHVRRCDVLVAPHEAAPPRTSRGRRRSSSRTACGHATAPRLKWSSIRPSTARSADDRPAPPTWPAVAGLGRRPDDLGRPAAPSSSRATSPAPTAWRCVARWPSCATTCPRAGRSSCEACGVVVADGSTSLPDVGDDLAWQASRSAAAATPCGSRARRPRWTPGRR